LTVLTNWAASAPVPSATRRCRHSPSTPDSETTTYVSGSSPRDDDYEIIRWYSISSSRIVTIRLASRLPDQSCSFRRSPISVTTVAWFCMMGTSSQLVRLDPSSSKLNCFPLSLVSMTIDPVVGLLCLFLTVRSSKLLSVGGGGSVFRSPVDVPVGVPVRRSFSAVSALSSSPSFRSAVHPDSAATNK